MSRYEEPTTLEKFLETFARKSRRRARKPLQVAPAQHKSLMKAEIAERLREHLEEEKGITFKHPATLWLDQQIDFYAEQLSRLREKREKDERARQKTSLEKIKKKSGFDESEAIVIMLFAQLVKLRLS